MGALGSVGCGEISRDASGSGGMGGSGWSTGGVDVGGGSSGLGGGPGSTEPPPDILGEVPCEPYRPSDAAWSSLPTTRPPLIAQVSASPSGHYLYTAGTWLDAGQLQQRALRSRDQGETWCVLATPEPVATIVASRADERLLYALTPSEAEAPSVLLRSADGGETWTFGDSPVPEGFFNVEKDTSDLETSLTDPNVVWLQRYVSTSRYGSELYLSRDAGTTWSAVRPSTLSPRIDRPPTGVAREMLGVAVDLNSADRVVAWGRVGPSGSLTALLWFASVDGGQSWDEIHPPDIESSSFVGAAVDSASVLYVSDASKLLSSKDWGATWTDRGAMPSRAWLSSMHSARSGHLFARNSTDVMWRTLDGGATWTRVVDGHGRDLAPVFAGRDGDLLVSVADRRLSVTSDGGRIWKPLSIVPLPTTVMTSPTDAQWLWARDEFAVLASANGGTTWSLQAKNAWTSSNRLLLDGADANAALLFDTQNGGLLLSTSRSEDGGRTWTPISFASPQLLLGATTCPASESCAVLLSMGGDAWQCELKKTIDRGRTWSTRSMPDFLCGGLGAPPENVLAMSPTNSEHLLAACSLGDVCETRDGGATWTQHSLQGGGGTVSSVAFLDERTVVLVKTLFNSQATFVLRSTDGGTTWDRVHESADAVGVITSKAHPSTAFLMHDTNAYPPYLNGSLSRSDDGGATWRAVSESKVPVDLKLTSVVDAPGGGFLATTRCGLVRFD